MNSLLLRALQCQNDSGRPPIWIMRQAGRYLPEYRQIREKHSLLSLFRNPEAVCDITRLPIDLLGVDAAILFTDILIVFDALGVEWDVKPGVGPVISPSQRFKPKPVTDSLSFVVEAIHKLKQQLDVPLIGFCGGPYTLASYLIEGGSSRDFIKTKTMLYNDPEAFAGVVHTLTQTVTAFLDAQIRAGVDVVQIFDTWASNLTPAAFRRFSLQPIEEVLRGIAHHGKSTILFAKGSANLAPQLASLSPSAVGLDWQVDIGQMRKRIPAGIALQGNLDPCALFAQSAGLATEIDRILNSMGKDPGFIFNLGHGITPTTPVESVHFLIDRVKQFS